jgi:hypothetical protein
MAQQTVRDSERPANLSDGKCDVAGVIARVAEWRSWGKQSAKTFAKMSAGKAR